MRNTEFYNQSASYARSTNQMEAVLTDTLQKSSSRNKNPAATLDNPSVV